MKEKLLQIGKVILNEWRSLSLILISLFFLSPFGVVGAITFPIGVVALALGVTQIARKILLPYVDIKSLLKGVKDHNIASAIVVFGVLIYFSVLFSGIITLLSPLSK